MERALIRSYRPEDRQAVRDIAWETAFMGAPADVFFSDRVLLADLLTIYFTDIEPGSCFVAESGGKVVGYVIGARNEERMSRSCLRLMPNLLLRFLFRGLFSAKDGSFLFRLALSALKGEYRGENFRSSYPAVLHINLKEGYRGQGLGGRLINEFQEYLKREKVPGVRLATMSLRARPFFEAQGFHLLSRHSRSYFRHIAGKDVEVSIYGKRLLD